MRVKAKVSPGMKHGFYGGNRIYDGQIFNIENESEFSEKWMIKLEEDKPKRGPKAKAKAVVEESGE